MSLVFDSAETGRVDFLEFFLATPPSGVQALLAHLVVEKLTCLLNDGVAAIW
jgi:hypothetical protein